MPHEGAAGRRSDDSRGLPSAGHLRVPAPKRRPAFARTSVQTRVVTHIRRDETPASRRG